MHTVVFVRRTGKETVRNQLVVANKLKEYLDAEIFVMMREIGDCSDVHSEYFTKRAMEWIERNAAGFRAQWDKKTKKIVAQKKSKSKKAALRDLE
jgi:hypothetical protein